MTGNKIHLPFDNIKFFLKDDKTGELDIKYVCDDCQDAVKIPYFWQFAPYHKDQSKRGYHFWCKDCYELRGGNIQ